MIRLSPTCVIVATGADVRNKTVTKEFALVTLYLIVSILVPQRKVSYRMICIFGCVLGNVDGIMIESFPVNVPHVNMLTTSALYRSFALIVSKVSIRPV